MKKTIILLSAFLALVGCSNFNFEISQDSQDSQNPQNSQNERIIDASKVVFNINVDKINEPATKGLKTDWVSDDVVYLFFEGNTTQYVKMTYNGSAWSYSPGVGTNYDGLSLAASGDKLSAVYMPGFVIGEATPSYVSNKWTIGTGLGGYILTAEAVDYTVTVGNVTTLNATLSMTAPANMMQVYINESAPASGNEYVLNMTNVKPFTFHGIAPGGAATITAGKDNFPLAAYNGALGTETGYYFWGILAKASAGAIDYKFQLVEQNAEKKYAISSKSKTVTGKNLTGPTAIKLSSLTDNGKFVSLGFGLPWATGNLDKTNRIIVDPLEAGEYFTFGNPPYTGKAKSLPIDNDAAYQANNAWRIPSRDQFDALIRNTKGEWKSGWTSFGSDNGGYLFTSNSNGISLFFAAAGFYNEGTINNAGVIGTYWSSTTSSDSSNILAYYLRFNNESISASSVSARFSHYSVRPVLRVQN